ncbi:MAG TPA: hypothetical protein VKU41_21445, partial [Polyangiaceae bacterium]|nr:hypothetical protein [Polyangiaceae bacterium]
MSFLAAVALHSLGHALVALVAGALAVALAARLGMGGASSGRLWPGAPLEDQAFCLTLVGFAILVVKGTAGAYATFVQARIAGEVGSALRLDLLDSLFSVHRLRHPRHGDHGSPRSAHASPAAQAVAALTERVREVETGLEQGLLGGARAAAQLVPLAALLVALSPPMAAAAVVVLAAFGASLRWARSGHRRAMRSAAREREQLLDAADQAV